MLSGNDLALVLGYVNFLAEVSEEVTTFDQRPTQLERIPGFTRWS